MGVLVHSKYVHIIKPHLAGLRDDSKPWTVAWFSNSCIGRCDTLRDVNMVMVKTYHHAKFKGNPSTGLVRW